MKLSSRDRAYLAGICDGEGTITLRETGGRIVVYCIALTNTNADLIAGVIQILKKAGIRTYLSQYSGTHHRQGRKWTWQLLLAGIDNVKLYLRLIRPYLIGKKAQADLVLKFLENRKSGRRVGRKTEQDMFIYWSLRKLNQRGTSESVETVRSTSQKLTTMIQSELTSDSEKLAETTNSRLFN